MKYTYGTKYLMDKMNEELKAKGYKTKCYRSELGSWVVEAKETVKKESEDILNAR